MVRLYNTISPILLLITGWVLIFTAVILRVVSGDPVPWLNLLFVIAGLAIFFIPPRLFDLNKGNELKRKLLWVLLLAGLVIILGEIYKILTGSALLSI